MIVRNIVAKGYLFLIFLAWGNIMSRRHIWLTNERYIKFFWMKKIYFQIVMIFLECDLWKVKLYKDSKALCRLRASFLWVNHSKIEPFYKTVQNPFFGNNFWNTGPNEANEGSMDSG